METKYVIINGFAFSEESDMEMLKDYAREGWLLEGIKVGFFYKLRKGEPKDIEYSLDYQNEATEEYFNFFKEAGWTPVISLGDEIHIFSAPAGTKAIYSDRESEMDKYYRMKKQSGKGTLYSLITTIILAVLLFVSAITIRPIFLIVLILFVISLIVFIFNFMPYLAFNSRLKHLSKDSKGNNGVFAKKNLWKVDAFCGIEFLIIGILYLIEKKYFGIYFVALGIYNIGLSFNRYRNRKA